MPRLYPATRGASSTMLLTQPTVTSLPAIALHFMSPVWPRRVIRGAALVAAWVLVFAASARVEAAPAYEGFDYPVGTQHSGLTGGTNFMRVASDAASTVAPGSLSDPTGTLLTSGNHLEGPTGTAGTLLSYQLSPFTLTGNEFWVSFLMRQGAVSTGWTGMAMLSNGVGMYVIGEPGGGPGDGTLVISGGSDGSAVSSGVPFEANRDYFLVGHVQRGPGNDLATLYVNPTPGTEPPAGGVTYSGTDFLGGPTLFTFHVVAAPTITASFDELRVGTTYAEVAPVVPEPTTSLACLVALSMLALRRWTGAAALPR